MRRIDPMVRLLLLAIFLATLLPVSARWAGAAQVVSNAAVFLLFFGLSLLEALETRNWLKAALWIAIGLVFLRADALRREP
jgi:hypothetical protein